MDQKFDVLIVGAGVIGLTAAIAMALRKFHVAVVDAKTIVKTNGSGRVYAINPTSQKLFKHVEVWEELDRQKISPYQKIIVWDALSNAELNFDCRMIAANALGFIIAEAELQETLLREVEKYEQITIFANNPVEKLTHKQNTIVVHSASCSWEADLLMVADGSNSKCRKLLNIPVHTWSYHQTAITCLMQSSKASEHTAYQVFNKSDILAFLPMHNDLCSLVLSTAGVRAKHLMALSDEDFNTAITNISQARLGNIKVQGSRISFPLHMQHVRQYSGENWLILGDAAHTIHPMAGLGLNLGLADLNVWLNCLEKNKDQMTKRCLGFYQRQRKSSLWQIIWLMEGLKTLFSSQLPFAKELRQFGLHICDNLTPLKKLFINYASGRELT